MATLRCYYTSGATVKIIELRVYLSCTAEETAGILNLSKATVERDMRMACAWLCRELRPENQRFGAGDGPTRLNGTKWTHNGGVRRSYFILRCNDPKQGAKRGWLRKPDSIRRFAKRCARFWPRTGGIAR
jgi:hypothetical protein